MEYERLSKGYHHGLQKIWLFPTLGMIYEEPLKHDPEAVTLLFRAFNQWLLEDWGFAYEDRIFAGPYISLADPKWAEEEVEWMVDNGARVIVMRPAAAFTELGASSPFAPKFDGVWGRINEAGIPVVIHAGDSGNSSNGYAVDGFSASFSGGGWAPSISGFKIERAAFEFMITSVFEKLFDRFPNLRMASVENGSDFLPDLLRKVRNTTKKKVLLVSTDVYRPAAIDQLATLAKNLEVDLFPSDPSHKPVDIAAAALDWARKHYHDVLIVDTAGRLGLDQEMM
jgi:predicted TIM-barrel fold metal-dependent hydrolase